MRWRYINGKNCLFPLLKIFMKKSFFPWFFPYHLWPNCRSRGDKGARFKEQWEVHSQLLILMEPWDFTSISYQKLHWNVQILLLLALYGESISSGLFLCWSYHRLVYLVIQTIYNSVFLGYSRKTTQFWLNILVFILNLLVIISCNQWLLLKYYGWWRSKLLVASVATVLEVSFRSKTPLTSWHPQRISMCRLILKLNMQGFLHTFW